MRPALAAALEAVALRLDEHGIPYLLGGSALLHALGLPGEVGDIDLMLREQDRARFEAATTPWWRATTTEPAGRLRGAWKATLDVNGEEVEGLGGFALGIGDTTVALPWRGAGTWRCGGADVPLAAPELWWAVYLVHMSEKARALEAIVGPSERVRIAAELGIDRGLEHKRR